MRIYEIEKSRGNTEPENVLLNIVDMIHGAPCSTGYCYGQVAKAIADQSVSDDDLIVLLGSGESSFHGIVADRKGNPKVDAYHKYFDGIHDDKYVYIPPMAPDNPKAYAPVKVISVGNFKKKYLNQA